MKIAILIVMILATVSSVVMAQIENKTSEVVATPVAKLEVAQQAPCPVPPVKKASVRPTVVKPKVALLPAVGWPDWLMGSLIGVVLVLALLITFLLGRITAGQVQHQPQVVAPVVYVQPPPLPAHP